MTGPLWIMASGGHRVATDEIFALIDHVEAIRVQMDHHTASLRHLAHSSGVHTVSKASVQSDEWVDWAVWFRRALDDYCVSTAEAERLRTTWWEKPRDALLLTLVRGLTGQSPQGGEPGSSVDDAAAAVMGGQPSSNQPYVEQVSREQRVEQASSLAERIGRIPETGTPVRVERYVTPDGHAWVEVFISGTDSLRFDGSDTPFDMASNLALVAGVSAASVLATTQAMGKAGVKASDRVVFIGHSQGGAVAHTLAESGRYRTAGLISVGAPSATVPVRGDYPALTIEHSDDVVPRLSGARVATEATVVTTHSGAGVGDVLGAHDKARYAETAAQIDQSPARILSEFSGSFPHGLTGQATTFRASWR